MHADARNLLWDARQAAERVVRFTHGKTFADYQADELLRSAVERQLEIVGEALNQLSRVDSASGTEKSRTSSPQRKPGPDGLESPGFQLAA